MTLEQDVKALELAFVALVEHVHDEETRCSCYWAASYLHNWACEFAWLVSTKKCSNELCKSGYVSGTRKHAVKLCPVCKGKKRTKKGETKCRP